MGSFFPPLDREQVEDILKNSGFILKRREASHAQWEGCTGGKRRIVTVDHLGGKRKEKYGRELLGKMIQQSGLSKKEFYSHLKK
jgi:predicted RNA binding protein YcfA (HicA-like mRNA interferase family)